MNRYTEMQIEEKNEGIPGVCQAACKKLLAEVEGMKQRILTEFHSAVSVPAHILELALNEAEALAMESGIPQLVFPTLAMEKAQGVVAWYQRQQSLRAKSRGYAMAV